MAILSTIYPPIVKTYTPTFVRTGTCRVYFSLSQFNNINNIKNVQITIVNQNTNISSFDSKIYTSNIKISNINIDATITNDYKYYITIEPSDLKSKIFELNQVYKVQLRFTDAAAADIEDSSKIASWLYENQAFFSEWSTVNLVSGIEKPEIKLNGFASDGEFNDALFSGGLSALIGSMYYEENGNLEKEYLKQYQFTIYDNNEALVLDSGILFPFDNGINEINYILPKSLDDGVSYSLHLSFTTNGGYTNSKKYSFMILQGLSVTTALKIEPIEEIENARIKLVLNPKDELDIIFESVVIRRTSSETNFTVWEDLRFENFYGATFPFVFYDSTIVSGITYRYGIQRVDAAGARGILTYGDRYVKVIFDDMFLNGNEKQLKIKFNPTISSFKRNISESTATTLGSKYPFVRHVGMMDYREFPIGGLISMYMDDNNLFSNISGNYVQDEDHFIKERLFREEVLSFLYNKQVKLFRSTTEGNVLVKLTNITCSPTEGLGRLIYSFSATAVEIDESCLYNYDIYNIQNINQEAMSKTISIKSDRYGQLVVDNIDTKTNLIDVIKNDIKRDISDNIEEVVTGLSWVKVSYDADPYLIECAVDGTLHITDDLGIPNTMIGHFFTLNNIDIIVRDTYEVHKGEDLITSMYLGKREKVVVDYIAIEEQRPVAIDQEISLAYYHKTSQISGLMKIKESLMEKIKYKHEINTSKTKQEILSLNRIYIEGVPGSALKFKSFFDDEYRSYVIGMTGDIQIYSESDLIEDFYVEGLFFTEAEDPSDPKVWECFIGNNVYLPEERGIYTIDNQRKIYYNNQFYDFGEDNMLKIPISLFINYYFDLSRREY